MRSVIWAAVTAAVLGAACLGQTTGPTPEAERIKIEAEISKLAETPTGKKFAEFDRRMHEARRASLKAEEEVARDLNAFRETEEGKAHVEKIELLRKSVRTKWEDERDALAKEAKALYGARHVELKKGAAGELLAARKLGLDPLTFPRLDGSTSTHPLMVIVASRVLGLEYEWTYPEPSGYPRHYGVSVPGSVTLGDGYDGRWADRYWGRDTDFQLAASRTFATFKRQADQRVAMLINGYLAKATNTHDAYENLILGKCDLNFTARGMSADEKKLAAEKGVKVVLAPIATDALVFIVNRNNTVKSLSRQQVLDVYDGKITAWTDLGWKPGETHLEKIVPVRREKNSGSQELYESLLLGGKEMGGPEALKRPDFYASDMGGPFVRATTQANVLGYSVYYYEYFMAASPFTRTIAIDGVEPSAETIASGKYPLASEVFVAYREGEKADSPAMKLLAWLLSDEGQAVVRESGYVPIKRAAGTRPG